VSKKTEKHVAESATGIAESPGGIGTLYSDEGKPLADVAAASVLIRVGNLIEAPNAGAGSYLRFFSVLGFEEVQVADSMASSGDWSFAVKDSKRKTRQWRPASQENRYPYHGFKYHVSSMGFESAKGCIDYMSQA
jgi:hypothetical protein